RPSDGKVQLPPAPRISPARDRVTALRRLMSGTSSHDIGTRARRAFIKSSRLTRICCSVSRQSRWPRMYRCGDGADDVGPPGVILGGFSFCGRFVPQVHPRTPPCAHWQLPPTRRRLEHSSRLGVTGQAIDCRSAPVTFLERLLLHY